MSIVRTMCNGVELFLKEHSDFMHNSVFIRLKFCFQYFCNLNDSEKLVHEIFFQQGCHPIVQTDGQSSALEQWVGFVRGGGQN